MNKRIRARVRPWLAFILAMAILLLVPAMVRADGFSITGSPGSEQLRRPELITVLLALAILVVSLAAIPFLFRQRKQGNIWRLFTGLCATLISMALVGTLCLALLYHEQQQSEEDARQDYQLALQEMKTFPTSLDLTSSDIRGWSWDPQGDTLAYLEVRPEVALFVFEPSGGTSRELVRYDNGSDPIFHAWSESGDYLICSQADRRSPVPERTFQVIDRQGNTLHELDLPVSRDSSGSSYPPALLSTGGSLYLVNIKPGVDAATGLESGSGTLEDGSFKLLSYDLTTGKEVARCTLPTSFLPEQLAYHPEGHISFVGFRLDGEEGNPYAALLLNDGLLSSGTLELLKIDPATLSIVEDKLVYQGPLQIYVSDISGNHQSAYLDPHDRFLMLRDAGGNVLAFDFRTGEKQIVPEDMPEE